MVVQWKRVDATFGERAQNATLSGGTTDRACTNIQNCQICLEGIVEANSIELSKNVKLSRDTLRRHAETFRRKANIPNNIAK
jgi:hypothetical protein